MPCRMKLGFPTLGVHSSRSARDGFKGGKLVPKPQDTLAVEREHGRLSDTASGNRRGGIKYALRLERLTLSGTPA